MALLFDPHADARLVALDADPGQARLVQRIDKALDALAADPSQRWLRRHRFQNPPVWAIVIATNDPGEDDWVILWQEFGPDIHVTYVNPASFA